MDDQVEQVESLKMLLDPMGYDVKTALTAEAAYLLAETHPPDLLLLDWVLPNGGVPFIDAVRRRTNNPRLPVVVITGLPLDCVKGLDGTENIKVVQKPYTVEEILDLLKTEKGRG